MPFKSQPHVPGELRNRFDARDPFVTGGHQILKPRSSKKQIPDWARDDKKVREIVLRSFPKLLEDDRQRKAAARWIRVIHLYFRMHMTRGQVAQEMGIESSQVRDFVRNIRRVAAGRRSDTKGVLGAKAKGRPKKIHASI